MCLCVCLGHIDTCKICMLAVLCTCALIHDTPVTVCGVGGWRAAAFLIPFNSIRWDVLTCVEPPPACVCKAHSEGASLVSHTP